jgi:hypothetical protein
MLGVRRRLPNFRMRRGDSCCVRHQHRLVSRPFTTSQTITGCRHATRHHIWMNWWRKAR